jgi:hypothetical protein
LARAGSRTCAGNITAGTPDALFILKHRYTSNCRSCQASSAEELWGIHCVGGDEAVPEESVLDLLLAIIVSSLDLPRC